MELKDIENLAELAKIELTQEEKEKILADMDGILAYVKQIEDIDVPEVEIEYEHRNAWREDEVEERDFDVVGILSQFPNSQDNFVKVKKIL
ncbi:MAG: Asp-tRNA(Asn)/Glu-tRNA(Gln) amidotransferase subunit GatC [Patescibacteria group bacterium]